MTHSVPATRGDGPATPSDIYRDETAVDNELVPEHPHDNRVEVESKAMQLASTINTNFFISKIWRAFPSDPAMPIGCAALCPKLVKADVSDVSAP